MTWITLICFLGLTSSVFGATMLASFPAHSLHKSIFPTTSKFESWVTRDKNTEQKPLLTTQIQNRFGQQQSMDLLPKLSTVTITQERLPQVEQKVIQVQTPTEADILCKGHLPETVIPLNKGEIFVVCLAEGKGVTQQCPRGLYYRAETRRCEFFPSPINHPCALNPCHNRGECHAIDSSSYKCQCVQGFEGKHCELDARICQTQNPCGQSPNTYCQSFHFGAALQYVCLIENGLAYGLSLQQSQKNPCHETDFGLYSLFFSDKGFLRCDGERMFIESCPRGTIWSDLNKVCVWSDMLGVANLKLIEEKSEPTDFIQRTVIVKPHINQVQTSLFNDQSSIEHPRFEHPVLHQQTFSQSSSLGSQSLTERPRIEQPFIQPFIQPMKSRLLSEQSRRQF